MIYDDLPFWRTQVFWSAILMVTAYVVGRVWGFIISPEEQSAIVKLVLEIISLFGMAGVVHGSFRLLKKHK